LRENKNTQDISILTVSGNAHESEVKAGLAAGFDDYISKPLLLPEFIEKADYFLKKSRGQIRVYGSAYAITFLGYLIDQHRIPSFDLSCQVGCPLKIIHWQKI